MKESENYLNKTVVILFFYVFGKQPTIIRLLDISYLSNGLVTSKTQTAQYNIENGLILFVPAANPR